MTVQCGYHLTTIKKKKRAFWKTEQRIMHRETPTVTTHSKLWCLTDRTTANRSDWLQCLPETPMNLVTGQAGSTAHAAGRIGVPEEPAEGETGGQGEVCWPSTESAGASVVADRCDTVLSKIDTYLDVCDILIVLQVCDLNFITILWWSHNCSIFITILWLK